MTQICKKKGIDNSKKEWSLIVQVPLEALQESQGGEEDFIILPEDRTVESLGEIRELELRKLGKRVDHPANLRLNNDPSGLSLYSMIYP